MSVSLLRDILPDWVAVSETTEDTDESGLFPVEVEVIAKAVAKRRGEFTTVRACARAALTALGLPAAPILPGERGAPQWPEGVVGSMTHCAGYRAAALATAATGLSVGVDAEPHGPLPDGVLDLIAREEERHWLAEADAVAPGRHWERLLFSAKESVYKTWFPLTHRWLDFHEASIRLRPDAGTFTAALLVPGPIVAGIEITHFEGTFAISDEFVVSAIALPA